MAQAIATKIRMNEKTADKRISATAAAGRKYYDWDDRLNSEENQDRAAKLFAKSLGWLDKYRLVGGTSPKTGDERYYVLVRK